jgi:hypothetical protein
MYPGSLTGLTFIQPIQSHTRDSLMTAINRHDKVSWEFGFSADAAIQGTGHTIKFSPQPLQRVEIPYIP